MKRRSMRAFAFLALFAVALAALAPTVSYALAAGQGEAVVEMCTSFGIQKVKLPQNDNGPATPSKNGQHCPFCLAAHAAIPVLEMPRLADPATPQVARPLPVYAAPLYDLSLSWFAIRSHAPPAFA